MVVQLWRAQLGTATGLDVSRKSGGQLGRRFSPSWDLIMAKKRGQIGWAEFSRRYLDQLLALPEELVSALYEEGLRRGGQLCLLCYCRDGKNCHTLVLIEWLVRQYPGLFEVKVR